MSMDDQQQPELSLGSCRSNLSLSSEAKNSSSDSDLNASAPANNPSRKRKPSGWHTLDDDPNLINQATIDLQLNHHPLPVDWEQCLDLQSGRMFYLNRKSLKRSWMRPNEEKLDLELNISSAFPPPDLDEKKSSEPEEDAKMAATSAGNMVAAVCVNCHLLVMLCKSSPSCPNCKCNSLPPPPPPSMMTTSDHKLETVKSLKTLSLLH